VDLEAELAVFLIPARTDTRWFHDIVLPHAREIRFLRGRLKFGEAKKDGTVSQHDRRVRLKTLAPERIVHRMNGTDDIAPLRTVLIDRVRRELADGTYEHEAKLDAAVDKVLGVLVDEASDVEEEPERWDGQS
jgi:hypothetical protein